MTFYLESMLEKFFGCDSGDIGNPTSPSIWLFGIEPGWSITDQIRSKRDEIFHFHDNTYSIKQQLTWPFNRNAFKLLTAMNDGDVTSYKDFAERHQPFVKGSKGYFKGNLYPYACNRLRVWPEEAAKETGLENKAAYQQWCRTNRWPVIKHWVDEYQPRLFIGVGISFRMDFSKAVFGSDMEMKLISFSVNNFEKKLFFARDGWRKLAVIPHLSGSRHGLNSDLALAQAGSALRNFMQNDL